MLRRANRKIKANGSALLAQHPTLGGHSLHVDGSPAKLFCENETNAVRLYGLREKAYFKDAFHEHIVNKHSLR